MPPDPDIALIVDYDAVVRIRPIVALPRTAPVPDEIALLIELRNGWSRKAAFRGRRILSRLDFLGVERAGAMDNPDVVVGIDRYADRLAEQPVVG